MPHFILVFIGGGLGAASRYGLSTALTSSSHKIPWGILACNLLGCLLIGALYGFVKSHHPHWISPLAVTGFLGGFTTFSTFALDTQKLVEAGNYGTAISYVLISIIAGLALSVIGCMAAVRF